MNTIQSYVPGIYEGNGMGAILMLSDYGQGLTSATNNIDQYKVPSCALRDRTTNALRVGAVTITVNSLGTGATSGNWTFAVAVNGVNQPSMTGMIAYNASVPIVDIEVSANGPGYALKQGDVISLNLTGVPAGTLSGGAKGIKARLYVEGYGVNA